MITIKTQSFEEALVIKAKIRHYVSSSSANENGVSFTPAKGVSIMTIANLLEVPGNRALFQPSKSVACNLAAKIAWLEGLSVASECTGENYCEIFNPNRRTVERIKYDPIGRGAILIGLIKKYEVDLDWLEDGDCNVRVWRWGGSNNDSEGFSSSNSNGCFASAVLKAILDAKKS